MLHEHLPPREGRESAEARNPLAWGAVEKDPGYTGWVVATRVTYDILQPWTF